MRNGLVWGCPGMGVVTCLIERRAACGVLGELRAGRVVTACATQ